MLLENTIGLYASHFIWGLGAAFLFFLGKGGGRGGAGRLPAGIADLLTRFGCQNSRDWVK